MTGFCVSIKPTPKDRDSRAGGEHCEDDWVLCTLYRGSLTKVSSGRTPSLTMVWLPQHAKVPTARLLVDSRQGNLGENTSGQSLRIDRLWKFRFDITAFHFCCVRTFLKPTSALALYDAFFPLGWVYGDELIRFDLAWFERPSAIGFLCKVRD